MKVAITGEPGAGKTTLLRQVIESIGLSVGGIITQDIREGGSRKGFKITDIATGEEGVLSHVDVQTGPRVGKYKVNLEDIRDIAIPAIENALGDKELIVIDEIAPMELKSSEFVKAVEKALESEKHLLFSVHKRSAHPLVKKIRDEFTFHEVTKSNCDKLLTQIVADFAI